MPISPPQARQEIHDRNIAVKVFARDDRLYDVEARLIDRKPFAFWRVQRDIPVPAGEPLHDLSIRVTVDGDLVVRAIEASSDTTPFDLCREAERTLAGLIGERIAAGWSSKVKSQLRGAASCTHLMEMLITLATPALQGIRGLARRHRPQSEASGIEKKLDTCFAYSRQRTVVKMYWPEHYRGPESNQATDARAEAKE